MMALVERSNLQRSLRKMDILATVQKYHQICRTKAVLYSHMDVDDGMELLDTLVRQGFLEKTPNLGNGRGYIVMLTEKGRMIVRKYREMLELMEES